MSKPTLSSNLDSVQNVILSNMSNANTPQTLKIDSTGISAPFNDIRIIGDVTINKDALVTYIKKTGSYTNNTETVVEDNKSIVDLLFSYFQDISTNTLENKQIQVELNSQFNTLLQIRYNNTSQLPTQKTERATTFLNLLNASLTKDPTLIQTAGYYSLVRFDSDDQLRDIEVATSITKVTLISGTNVVLYDSTDSNTEYTDSVNINYNNSFLVEYEVNGTAHRIQLLNILTTKPNGTSPNPDGSLVMNYGYDLEEVLSLIAIELSTARKSVAQLNTFTFTNDPNSGDVVYNNDTYNLNTLDTDEVLNNALFIENYDGIFDQQIEYENRTRANNFVVKSSDSTELLNIHKNSWVLVKIPDGTPSRNDIDGNPIPYGNGDVDNPVNYLFVGQVTNVHYHQDGTSEKIRNLDINIKLPTAPYDNGAKQSYYGIDITLEHTKDIILFENSTIMAPYVDSKNPTNKLIGYAANYQFSILNDLSHYLLTTDTVKLCASQDYLTELQYIMEIGVLYNIDPDDVNGAAVQTDFATLLPTSYQEDTDGTKRLDNLKAINGLDGIMVKRIADANVPAAIVTKFQDDANTDQQNKLYERLIFDDSTAVNNGFLEITFLSHNTFATSYAKIWNLTIDLVNENITRDIDIIDHYNYVTGGPYRWGGGYGLIQYEKDFTRTDPADFNVNIYNGNSTAIVPSSGNINIPDPNDANAVISKNKVHSLQVDHDALRIKQRTYDSQTILPPQTATITSPDQSVLNSNTPRQKIKADAPDVSQNPTNILVSNRTQIITFQANNIGGQPSSASPLDAILDAGTLKADSYIKHKRSGIVGHVIAVGNLINGKFSFDGNGTNSTITVLFGKYTDKFIDAELVNYSYRVGNTAYADAASPGTDDGNGNITGDSDYTISVSVPAGGSGYISSWTTSGANDLSLIKVAIARVEDKLSTHSADATNLYYQEPDSSWVQFATSTSGAPSVAGVTTGTLQPFVTGADTDPVTTNEVEATNLVNILHRYNEGDICPYDTNYTGTWDTSDKAEQRKFTGTTLLPEYNYMLCTNYASPNINYLFYKQDVDGNWEIKLHGTQNNTDEVDLSTTITLTGYEFLTVEIYDKIVQAGVVTLVLGSNTFAGSTPTYTNIVKPDNTVATVITRFGALGYCSDSLAIATLRHKRACAGTSVPAKDSNGNDVSLGSLGNSALHEKIVELYDTPNVTGTATYQDNTSAFNTEKSNQITRINNEIQQVGGTEFEQSRTDAKTLVETEIAAINSSIDTNLTNYGTAYAELDKAHERAKQFNDKVQSITRFLDTLFDGSCSQPNGSEFWANVRQNIPTLPNITCMKPGDDAAAWRQSFHVPNFNTIESKGDDDDDGTLNDPPVAKSDYTDIQSKYDGSIQHKYVESTTSVPYFN
jgi:hypothetical protein